MDASLVNPFLNAVVSVMGQFGLPTPERTGLNVYPSEVKATGVAMLVGIVGDKKGNVVYSLSVDDSLKIVSKMMGGMEIAELDDMSKSALSELSNILTANATTNFSTLGINLDISVPTMLTGEDFVINIGHKQVLGVDFMIGDISLRVYIEIS